MDHQSRASRQISVLGREEAHERRPGRIDCRFAEENEATGWGELAVEADILAHHAGDLGIATQGRELHDDQAVLRGAGQLVAKAGVHIVIDFAAQEDGGILEVCCGKCDGYHDSPFVGRSRRNAHALLSSPSCGPFAIAPS